MGSLDIPSYFTVLRIGYHVKFCCVHVDVVHCRGRHEFCFVDADVVLLCRPEEVVQILAHVESVGCQSEGSN